MHAVTSSGKRGHESKGEKQTYMEVFGERKRKG